MNSFAYESVEITNKDDFEKEAISIAKTILEDNIDKLEEIVLTTDINGSLKKRMPREEFEEWVSEQVGGYVILPQK